MPIFMVIFGLLLLQILFYFGEKVHSDLLNISHMIYETEWHRYPCKIRLYVLLMMVRSQKPFYLSAYGIIDLHLINFVGVSILTSRTKPEKLFEEKNNVIPFQVLKWIYSALMVFRTMEWRLKFEKWIRSSV